MGAPMARNLTAKHDVVVWNRTCEKAEGLGATVADSPAEAVDGADVVITMLADGPTVAKVMEGITLTDGSGLVAGEHRRRRVDRQARLEFRRRAGDGHPQARRGRGADRARLRPGRDKLGDVFDLVAAKVIDLGDGSGPARG